MQHFLDGKLPKKIKIHYQPSLMTHQQSHVKHLKGGIQHKMSETFNQRSETSSQMLKPEKFCRK